MRLKWIILFSLVATAAIAQWTVQHRRGAFAVPTITMGETTMLSVNDSSSANTLIAQVAGLSQNATLMSLSFYVSVVGGDLILGVYDDDGIAGKPGTKLAETAPFTPVLGWNTVSVVSGTFLTAGNYWLAFNPQDAALGFYRNSGLPDSAYYTKTYDGTLPATFNGSPSLFAAHWSFYATLQP